MVSSEGYNASVEQFLKSFHACDHISNSDEHLQGPWKTRKVFKKKHTCGLLFCKTWLHILIIIINTKLTSYTSH